MNRTDTLLNRSLKAVSWSYSGVAVSVLLQVAASVLFARVLGTRITGTFAFGLLVFPPFRFLCEFGLGSALVQMRDPQLHDIQLAFSRSVVLAVITALAWLVCIGVLASWMDQAESTTALNCLALVLLSLPLQTIAVAVLTKRLDQKFLQVSALVSYAVGYLALGGYGALHGWGVWSLVLGFVAQNFLATVLMMWHVRFSLRLKFSSEDRSLWRFGARAAAINVSNWLTSSLDNMAVAWAFGTSSLGVYSLAYTLVRTPADKIVTTLQSVLFPASVLAQGDRERLARGSIAAIDAVLLLTVPAFCAVAVLSATIVEALYGPAWSAAAAVLPAFAFAMILHCLTVVVSALLWGLGGVDRDMRIQWGSAAALLLAVIFAARISFVAVAWTVVPVTLVRALLGIRALGSTIGIPIRRLVRALVGGLILGGLITPILAILDAFLSAGSDSAIARLAWELLFAVLAWVGAVGLLRGWLMTTELRGLLQSAISSFKSGSCHA